MPSSVYKTLVVVFIGAVLWAVGSCSRPVRTTAYVYPQLNFFPEMPVLAGTTVEGADLGRHLFYDPILSLDSTIACASCHKQEAAFSDAPHAFSKGVNGQTTTRNAMPLLNLAWHSATMFWDGKSGSIEEQVFHPVRTHTEMNLTWAEVERRINASKFYRQKFKTVYGNATIDSVLIARAIGEFERTLISNNSRYDRILRGEELFTEDELAGFDLMNDQTKGNCLHCHTTDSDALGTTGRFSNNGLDRVSDMDGYKDKGRGAITNKASDMGLFRIPSLRNVALTAPYMHDGRFATLDDVLTFYSEGVNPSPNVDAVMSAHEPGVRLTEKEKYQIKQFLLTLTDSVFITNPAYSNPFD